MMSSLQRSYFPMSAKRNEAIAVALVLQGRFEDAAKYMEQLNKQLTISKQYFPERTILAEARSGSWHRFEAALRRLARHPSQDILRVSCICAAAYGDIELLNI